MSISCTASMALTRVTLADFSLPDSDPPCFLAQLLDPLLINSTFSF
jgi:hypothetical protein